MINKTGRYVSDGEEEDSEGGNMCETRHQTGGEEARDEEMEGHNVKKRKGQIIFSLIQQQLKERRM